MGIEHANAGKGPAKVRQGHHDAARLDRISHGLRLMARALRRREDANALDNHPTITAQSPDE